MSEGIESKRTHSGIDWYIRGFVMSSLLLQVLLCFLPPLRRRTYSRWVFYVVSMVFSLSTWIPTFTFVLICGRAIFSYKDTSEYNPPLLMWSALMLLHIAGHGQERETPYSLQKGDFGKEFFQILVKFVIYDVLLFGIIFLFQSVREISNFAVPLVSLACMRTFSKLKNLWDQRKERDGRLITSATNIPFKEIPNPSDETIAHYLFRVSQRLLIWPCDLSSEELEACLHIFRQVDRSRAIKIIEAELNLIYNNFYGGVLPSMFEVVMVSLLPAFEAYSTTSFQAYIYPVVHLFIITLLSIFSNPKFSLPLFISWYVHMINQRMTSRHGPKELGILADGYIIDAAALICTHQLVVHLWLKQQKSLVQQCNDRQPQRHPVQRLIALFNLREYELPRKMFDYYLWQPLLNDGQANRHRWSNTIPRFNLLVHGLRKPRKVPAFIHCQLNMWPVSSTEQYDTDRVCRFILNEISGVPYYDFGRKRNAIAHKGQCILWLHYAALKDLKSPFEVNMLRWHLATGILHHADNTSASTSSDSSYISNQDMSMVLSDYMAYLLMVQPWIMSKQRGDTSRISQDALLDIIGLIHSIDVQGDQQSWTEEMQLKKICTQMTYFSRYSLPRKRETSMKIQKIVELQSKMQLSLNKILQFLSIQYSGKEQQSPLPKEEDENDQATREKEPQPPPPPPRERDHNKYLHWQKEVCIKQVVQSLSTMQRSVSEMSHILSLQDSKEVLPQLLPKDKDKQDPTTKQIKKPPQGRPTEKDQTKFLDGKELIEDLNRKVIQSLSEMQRSLNKMLPILSLQDSRKEQQPALSKEKDAKDLTDFLAWEQLIWHIKEAFMPLSELESRIKRLHAVEALQSPQPREKEETDQTKALVLDQKQHATSHKEKDHGKYIALDQEQQLTSPTEKDKKDQAKFLDWLKGTLYHATAVGRSLLDMETSFRKFLDIQRLQISMEEQTFPWLLKKDRQNKSLVKDACDLAEKIKSEIPYTNEMWRIIAKVWAGMLAYTAFRSDPLDHIRSLSEGGELASIVWLYMLHLGFVEQFD